MSDLAITANNTPGLDEILNYDVEYHLGHREDYAVDLRHILGCGASSLDIAFFAFDFSTGEVILGDEYKKHYKIGQHKIEEIQLQHNAKIRRTVETINRDFALLDRSKIYAFNLQDARRCDYGELFGSDKPIPVFQYHRLKGLKALITPLFQYHQYPSWNIPAVEDKLRFRDKMPKAFWRGALSSDLMTPRGYRGVHLLFRDFSLADDVILNLLRQSGRFFTCESHAEDPQVDAKLVINFGDDTYPNFIPMLESLTGERASVSEHLEHKYLLALDGYDGPSNFYWMLNSNSLVLKQDSEWEMFGDCYFAPWVHYVPISSTCHDLSEKLNWCERNQEKCEVIISNARAAWSVLFDADFQSVRKKRIYGEYSSWV